VTGKRGESHHAMAAVSRVRLENAVCCRIVAGSIHGIRARLIQRCGKAHIARCPPGDGDLVGHGVLLLTPFLRRWLGEIGEPGIGGSRAEGNDGRRPEVRSGIGAFKLPKNMGGPSCRRQAGTAQPTSPSPIEEAIRCLSPVRVLIDLLTDPKDGARVRG